MKKMNLIPTVVRFVFSLHNYQLEDKHFLVETSENKFSLSCKEGSLFIYGSFSLSKEKERKIDGDYQIFLEDECYNFHFTDGSCIGDPEIYTLHANSKNGTIFSYYTLPLGELGRRSLRFCDGKMVKVTYRVFSYTTFDSIFSLSEPLELLEFNDESALVSGRSPLCSTVEFWREDKLDSVAILGSSNTVSVNNLVDNNSSSQVRQLQTTFQLRRPLPSIRTMDMYRHSLISLFDGKLLKVEYDEEGSLYNLTIIKSNNSSHVPLVKEGVLTNEQLVKWLEEKVYNPSITATFKFGTFEGTV